jgi:predicted flap endonuclease-1-like 5' DNA nuclease
MDAIWFLLGIVVGAALAWLVLQRLSDRRVAEAEERVAAELAHARAQATDADQAHAETKERLIAVQARLQEAEAALERRKAELVAAQNRLAALEARLEEAEAACRRLEAELAETRRSVARPTEAAPVASAPATSASATAAPEPARASGPEEELRRLDARLAMLPAGSSARALLLKRRAELVARIEHPPVPHLPPPPPAPPPGPLPARSEPARDDLKLIKGIGPVLERRLHELGVKSFADLATLTPERVKEIDEAIEFPGRIERERWIEQAKELLARRPN